MTEAYYSNPDQLENAERHRNAQKMRDERDAKRRAKLNKSRVANGKRAKGPKRPRILDEVDHYKRPIYRPGMGKDFYKTSAWIQARYQVLQRFGSKCQCCGATKEDGVRIHVDHIKPRSRFPLLELVQDNLQVLCADCNIGKGAWDQTDWRDGAGITHPRLTAIKAAHG